MSYSSSSSDEEEEEDGPRPLVGFLFGNVNNRLKLKHDEGRYLGEDGRERLDALGGGKLDAGGDLSRGLQREAVAPGGAAAAASGALEKAPDAEDYEDIDEAVEEPAVPAAVAADAARYVAAATGGAATAADAEDDYDADEAAPAAAPAAPAAPPAAPPRAAPAAPMDEDAAHPSGPAKLPESSMSLPGWARDLQAGQSGPVAGCLAAVAFARPTGPPPSRRRRGARAAAVEEAAAAAAAVEAYEEEEEEEAAAAAAAAAATTAGVVVAPRPAATAAAPPGAPAAAAAAEEAEDAACYGQAHPSGFAPVHQRDWEEDIAWGDERDSAAAQRGGGGAAAAPAEADADEECDGEEATAMDTDAAAPAQQQQQQQQQSQKHKLLLPPPPPPRAGKPLWEQAQPLTDAAAPVPVRKPAPPPLPTRRAHAHAQMLRLQPATPDEPEGPPADAGDEAVDPAVAAAAQRAALLPRRNGALAAGGWLSEVCWDGPRGAGAPPPPPPLLLDLNDAAMTFALRPPYDVLSDEAAAASAAAAAAAVALASATVLPPKLAAYAPPARRPGAPASGAAGVLALADCAAAAIDVAKLVAPLNVSRDEAYAARGNDAVQLRRHAQVRPGPLPVAHSLPALKLETAPPYMRAEDARRFHAPRAVMAPSAPPRAVAKGGVAFRFSSGGAARITVPILTLKEASGAELKAEVLPRDPADVLYAFVRRRWPEHAGGGFTLHAAKRRADDPFPEPLDPRASLEEQGITGGRVVFLVGRAVQPLPHRIASAVPGPDRPRAPPAAFQRVEDFSARDGHIYVVEYSEQHPLLLSNRGMGARRVCWYRKRSAHDVPPSPAACAGAEVQPLEPGGASPFLCEVFPGTRMPALETRMFRAPVWEHAAQDSDFLLVRTPTGRLLLRGMTRTAVVGHLEPHPQGLVMAPKAAEVAAFQERRLRLAVYRKLRAARAAGEPECVSLTDLAAEFPYADQSEAAIGKLIKDVCKPERSGSRNWVKLPGFDIPSEEALRQLVSPEAVCAYESMQAARERLRDMGIMGVVLINPKTSLNTAVSVLPKDPGLRATAAAIALELQLMPWAQTSEFLHAIQGRGTLALDTSRAGPARRGHVIHYARRAVRASETDETRAKMATQAPQRISGTSADLRKLSMGECAAELRKLGLTEAQIAALPRWGRVATIRELSKGAVKDDAKANQTRWVRHERESAAACARSQRDSANKLVARMARMYGAEEAWQAAAADGEDDDAAGAASDEDAADSDEEDLAKEFEAAMLEDQGAGRAAAAAARQAAAAKEEEERKAEAAAQEDLRRLLAGEDGGAGAAVDAGVTDPDHPGKRLRLVRVTTVIHPGGRREAPQRSLITDKSVLEAYLSAKREGKNAVQAVLAAQGPAGKLPYPLRGTVPPPLPGRQMKPELEARRAKEAIKREERKAKQAAAQYEKVKSGLTATAMQAGTTGPGGLAVASAEGAKLKLNLGAMKLIASRLKPEGPKKPWGGAKAAARRRAAESEEEAELEEEPSSEEEEEDLSGDSDSEGSGGGGGRRGKKRPRDRERDRDRKRAKTSKRARASPPPHRPHAAPAPPPTAAAALNELLRGAAAAVKRDPRFGAFVQSVNYHAVPDYIRKVGGPSACMTLTTMLQRCASCAYTSRAHFLADATKIVNAAYAYNAPRDGSEPGEQSEPEIAGAADAMMATLQSWLAANAAQMDAMEAAMVQERAAAEAAAAGGGDAAAGDAPPPADAQPEPATQPATQEAQPDPEGVDAETQPADAGLTDAAMDAAMEAALAGGEEDDADDADAA